MLRCSTDGHGAFGRILLRLLGAGMVALAFVSCRPDAPDTAPPEAPAWELAAADLRIVDDGSGEPLRWVRAMAEGADGRIHSLHERETFVRSWTVEGAPAGRPGAEPAGMLPDPRNLGTFGDTLWVLDGPSHRVHFFGPDGTLLGVLEASTEADAGVVAPWELPARPLRPLRSGDVLAMTPEVSEAVARGDQRRTVLVRMAADGTVRDTVWARPWEPWDVLPLPREGGGAYGDQPFADAPLWRGVPDGSRVVVTDRRVAPDGGTPSFHVTWIGSTGDTVARTTFPYEPVPLDDPRIRQASSEVAESWAAFLREVGDPVVPDELRDRIEEALYVPPHMPPVTDLVVASDGSAWLRRAATEADEGGSGTVEWWVLRPDGSLAARVSAPGDLRILQVGTGHVLGSVVEPGGSVAIVRHPVRR